MTASRARWSFKNYESVLFSTGIKERFFYKNESCSDNPEIRWVGKANSLTVSSTDEPLGDVKKNSRRRKTVVTLFSPRTHREKNGRVDRPENLDTL